MTDHNFIIVPTGKSFDDVDAIRSFTDSESFSIVKISEDECEVVQEFDVLTDATSFIVMMANNPLPIH